MTKGAAKIDEALRELRLRIEAVVREEQLRDQLTGLGNDLALSEAMKSAIETGAEFWCALVEVDYFKRLNDKFTYAVADGLLRKIAKRLEAFEDYVAGTVPVRAHGDEFYLFGKLAGADAPDQIRQAIERVREEIAGVRVGTVLGDMSCTVSIGWMTSADGGEEVLTERAVRQMVESATAAAKVRGRNCSVRYQADMVKLQRQSVRDDCAGCGASFTVEIPRDTTHSGELKCPNCGASRPRPAG